MIRNTRTLERLLMQTRLVRSALPSIEHVVKKAAQAKHIRLVYGETYDEFGMTIDSLKNYLFLELLKRELVDSGVSVEAVIVIGDLHSVMNKLVKDKAKLLSSGNERLLKVQHIVRTFGLNIKPMLMSDAFNDPAYANRLDTLRPVFQQSAELQEVARKTVLRNRLKQEEQAGFRYTLEEAALITGFDIKVGPPREIHYDTIARSLGPAVGNADFCGIYLAPSYPLGLNFDYFITHPEIEEFGLTPYKAGSNKLQLNRIIIGRTDDKSLYGLINSSFAPKNPELPNPVFDIYLIGHMAKALLEDRPFDLDETPSKDPAQLKTSAYGLATQYIMQPLAGMELAYAAS